MNTDKLTHIYSITMLCCLIFTMVFVLYVYFEKGFVTWDGLLTLGVIFSVNLMNINYWKECFKLYKA
jgi:hypothetical protein